MVGRLLLPKLMDAGHEVVGITRTNEGRQHIESLGASAFVADVFDQAAVTDVFSQIRPEVVIHQLTALSDKDFTENSRIRVEGTRNIVDASHRFGVTRMIAQSIAWAYESGTDPASEETPLDVHAAIPRQGVIHGVVGLERAVSEIREHVILRYGLFYGKGTWYTKGGFMAEEIMNGRLAATEGVTSFVHVEDAANAALQALEWPSGAVNIVDDEPAKGIEWMPVFAQIIGAPAPDQQSGRQPWERGASNAKATLEYGWKPIYPTWRAGFAMSLN